MKAWLAIALLVATPLAATPFVSADHVGGGLQWACGFGGSGREGHPDTCGINPVGGVDVGKDGDPEYGDAWIEDDERVLGVVLNGDARAIPVKMLDRHEILNDEIGGVPVAVTYCPLCGSGITFDRRILIGDTTYTLDFAASGFLYKHDLVMWDAQTGTLWTQILGEPIATLRDRHADRDHVDARLDTHPTILTSWRDWRAAHPDSTMLQPLARLNYGGAYAGYEDSCRIGISDRSQCNIGGLHPKEEVLGVVGPGGAVAFPYHAVAAAGGVGFHEGTSTVMVVGPTRIEAYDAGSRSFTEADGWRDQAGNAWDLANGTRIDGEETLSTLDTASMYWFAWKEHHPTTALWVSDDPEVPRGAKTLEDNGKLPGFTIGIVAILLLAGAWWLRRR